MFGHFLMLLSISSALGGVSVRMPYSNPAGVIYSNAASSPFFTSPYGPRTSFAYGSSYYTHDLHAPVAAPVAHVSAVAPVAPVVNVARLAHAAHVSPVAVQSGYYTHNLGANGFAAYANSAGQVAPIAAPLAHVPAVAAPIAAPFNGFVRYPTLDVHPTHAPIAITRGVVPAIQHVPAVAHVPVTKYQAEPGVIQNVVDVHKPQIASRKYEIRRPAIEKQFYDIEERIVVRPVGSAVVELDQPVSKNQRGPTVFRPATHADLIRTVGQPLAAVRTLPIAHNFTSVHTVPLAHQIFPGVEIHPINIQDHTESLNSIISTTEAPGLENAEQPEYPQELYPESPQEPNPQQPQEAFPQQPQQPFPQQQPQNIPEEQFDDSDSVSIENPELLRSRIQSRIPVQPANQFFSAQSMSQMQRQENGAKLQQQQFEQQFDALIQRQQLNGQIQRQQSDAPIQRQQISSRQFQQQVQSQISEPLSQNLYRNPPTQSRRLEENMFRSGSASQSDLPRMQVNSRTSQLRQEVDANQFRSSLEADIPRSTSTPDVIPSIRISPEQSLSNQDRLIALLTGQGGITEVRGTGENTIGGKQVRTRVLSVTPAPNEDSSENEKVNTRRIVVNRPIQTVEEVDVLQPFTNIERVAVHRPALIKTARTGLAQISTSIPVQTYAHAY